MTQYATHLVTREDESQSLTIFLPGEFPITVQDDHPNFDALLAAVGEQGNGVTAEDLYALADLSAAVAERFDRLSDRLSERVTVANGRVYFDGDEVDSALTRQILRCLDEGSDDWMPLVRFMENLAANPEPHSREQLFDWLRDREFTITQAGEFVAYKGVANDGDGGYQSLHSGHAIVDGEAVNGQVPTNPGSVVEMPRSSVAFDPSVGCSTGLHAGTYEYAQGYARGALLRVSVNPRDVVSVPTDSGAAKLRVCRYYIAEAIDAPETAPIMGADEDDEGEFCAYCGGPDVSTDDWGDPVCADCEDSEQF